MDEKHLPELASVFSLSHTANFPLLLRKLVGSIFVSTYQANRLLVCTAINEQKISTLSRVMSKPMGIALREKDLAVCLKNQIWYFSAVFGLGDIESTGIEHEFTFAPRRAHVTGDVAAHQAHFVGNDLYFVNTRFSCICKIENDSSFNPVWKPDFISELVAEDRCHLNGFCFDENDEMRYVTALGASNKANGWKSNKNSGGVLIDTVNNEIVTAQLCMPHSPKLHRGRLWVLESGQGLFLQVDSRTGECTEVVKLPGFLRGLSFFEQYAFIGLSKIRGKNTFRGIPIERHADELQCGVYVVDITTGNIVALIHFDKGVEEIFDVTFYPGAITPHLVGFEGELIDRVVSLPSDKRIS